ncbi:MAG: Unknown protein [uncultured Campylobacterales bacterium]|uniref:Uncharacterized protein n=1 Tax=uncultured Campylobacterales bacterium TaxID=352960 RepID=A0A6S6T465_9BACT|nr:MAG: Unknown protein [uncultured Campylobacterales bacterium]
MFSNPIEFDIIIYTILGIFVVIGVGIVAVRMKK